MKSIASKLPGDLLSQLAPLLGSLARMIAAGSHLDEEELETLLSGAGLEPEPVVLGELKRWKQLLVALKQKFTEEKRLATIEALRLRGLDEAPVLLAVHIVGEGKQPRELQPVSRTPKRLSVSVERLDFGILPPGQGATAEFEAQGGPGQIVIEASDLISVTPTQISAEPTWVQVELMPQDKGVVFTELKIVTVSQVLAVPVLAQWEKGGEIKTVNQANVRKHIQEWARVQSAEGERHLPVYLLLDISASMVGAPIESIINGLEQFQEEAASDPFARDVVKAGVITIGDRAEMVTNGLVAIKEFQPPELTPCKAEITRLDLAFQILKESFDQDVKKGIRGGPKGDWKPVVFVLLDGRPTDEHGNETDRLWQPARVAVIDRPKGQIKPSVIVAVGCGTNVDNDTLKAISTGAAFKMGTSESAFAALFQYLSQSID